MTLGLSLAYISGVSISLLAIDVLFKFKVSV